MEQTINVSVRTNGTPSAQYKTVILKPNVIDNVNTLTQAMMSQPNTKYVIKYDYTLAEDITVPANCVLEFDGGSIVNESGNNYEIYNENNAQIIGAGWLDNSVTITNQTYFKFSWLKGSDWSAYITKYNSGVTFDIDIDVEISTGISLTGLSNVSIISDHKTIKRVVNFFNMITIANSTDVTLKGFIVDGNKGSKTLDDGADYRFAGIYLDTDSKVVIDDVEIYNTLNNENNQSVIWVQDCEYITVKNGIFKGTQGTVIFFNGTNSHAIVDGCVARLVQGSFITGSVKDALFANNDIIGSPSDSINHTAISMNEDNNVAKNNIIQNIKGSGVGVAHSMMTYNNRVSGNVIKNCYLGGVHIGTATTVVIDGNVIENINTDNTEPDYYNGIMSRVANDIHVTNNIIKATNYAIHFEEKTGYTNIAGLLVYIENNELEVSRDAGILYKIPDNPLMVKNNRFKGTSPHNAISWSYTKFVQNVFYGDNNTAIAQFTGRRAMIEENVFINTGSNISLNLGASYVSRNNEGSLIDLVDDPAIDSNWIWATNS